MTQPNKSDISLNLCSVRTAYNRKKQPVQVRNALIECAASLAVSQGLNGITVQAVARAAGVTKGGFFHHFPHKQALLDAMFDDFLAESEREIDRLIAEDQHATGCFTRAYVMVSFDEIMQGNSSRRVPLSLSMMGSPVLCQRWASWLSGRLERHRHTDCQPVHQIVRLATDGAWLAQSVGNTQPLHDPLALREHLLTLIRESDNCENNV